ncbi:MAG: hypothetical protein ACRCYY_04975 [Trueperaceae bacterium]
MSRTKHSSQQSLKVLQALMLRDGLYGRHLAKSLGINEKTIYGILKRLEADEFVEAYWDVPGVNKPRLASPPRYLEDEETKEVSMKKGAPQRRYKLTLRGATFTRDLHKTFGKGKRK